MMVWKRWLLLNVAIFGIYVRFLGCETGRMECQHLRFQDETSITESHLPDILPLEMPFIISWRSVAVFWLRSPQKR